MRETRQRFQSSQQGVETPIYDRWILKLLAVLVVAACSFVQGESAPRQGIDPGLAVAGGAFVSSTAPANRSARRI